jgi:Uma2 family endonuclease
MAMATATQVPLSEYLHTSYEPDCEGIEGEVRERGMPDEFHSAIQFFFLQYFALLRRELGVRVRPELRLRVAPRRYRVPDVMLLPASAPFQPVADTPPLLCIEVLSPDDRAGELQEKIDDYLKMGVTAIWVVNPRLRKAFVIDRGAMLPVEELSVAGTVIRIPVSEVFAELDELEGRKSGG